MNRRTLLACASCAVFALAPAPARVETPSHSTSLLAGGERKGMLLAGLYISLAPQWKTYWRMPGQSGIPPQFDWTGSVNVKSVTVSYPAPARFADASGEVIGYHQEVLFPLLVEPLRPGQPVLLRLVALFGVCRDICIPARHELSLDLTAAEPDMRVAVWLQRVPQQVEEGAVGPVISGQVVEEGGQQMLNLNVTGEPEDIFVEHDTGAYFGQPVVAAERGHWKFAVSNVKSVRQLAGKPLRVTVSYGGKAVEQRLSLD